MRDLFIDIETYSSVDLTTCGAYKYISSPDFEILLIGYAFDNELVKVVDLLSGEDIPEELEDALFDVNCKKHAHNATFERLCFKRIGYNIPAEQWYCTAVKAAYCGLAFSLDMVSKILDLENKKLDMGKLLIKYFSCPCKPTKINGGRTRNYPEHAPEKWEMYKEYNKFDVEAEREIYAKLNKYYIPEIERRLYALDQKINDQGICVNITLANNAILIDTEVSEKIKKYIQDVSGIDNPGSNVQVKAWLEKKTGKVIESLAKDQMPNLLKDFADNPEVLELLTLRNQLSRTSVKKYYAMINCATSDSRVRGTFQFYGANRTGRWAGRLLQLQNLSKNHIDNIELPRNLLIDGDLDTLEMLYSDIPDILSQLVRTGIVAPVGKTLGVADFSAIEARVISWLANEKWRLDVFKGDGKIYEATGSKMFGVPISAITKGSVLRDKSKISELALGYEGSLGALKRMGGERMGLSDTEMMSLVRKWRAANPKIVELWNDLEESAIQALSCRRPIKSTCRNLEFLYDGENLKVTLPSGRALFYHKPSMRKAKNRTELQYYGMIQTTKQWGVINTYGGKLTENVVQAIARDLLAYTMLELDKAGYAITMHIHDEVIVELNADGSEKESYNKMVEIMSTPPEWALDLPLNAEGYITDFYKKD